MEKLAEAMKWALLSLAALLIGALSWERKYPLFKAHTIETKAWAVALVFIRATFFIAAVVLLVEAQKL